MIAGYFTDDGEPYVRANLTLPRLGVRGEVHFLIDTGTDATILHPGYAIELNCPFDELEAPVDFVSAGGAHEYYAEPAVVSFHDGEARHDFRITVFVAKPHPLVDELDSLLGRDILNRLRMDYEYPENRLEFLPR